MKNRIKREKLFNGDMVRKRRIYLFLVIIIILTGLASRSYPGLFPHFLAQYLGDTLWAATAYFVLCAVFPSIKIQTAGFISLLFSFFIEISQLYHAPWIDSVRANRFAALILGAGFLWSDLICYTAGILFAVLIDAALRRFGKRLG